MLETVNRQIQSHLVHEWQLRYFTLVAYLVMWSFHMKYAVFMFHFNRCLTQKLGNRLLQ